MKRIYDLPIYKKLFALIVLSSGISLLVASAAIVTYDSITYTKHGTADLKAQAEIIGASSTAALTFNDSKAATEYLSALKAKPSIVMAAIYGSDQRVFAHYISPRYRGTPTFPAPSTEGSRVKNDNIILFHVIQQDGKPIGTVYLRSELQLTTRLLSYGIIILLVIIISLVVGVLISLKLQRFISIPILEIARVAGGMIHNGNYAPRPYTERAKKHGQDEIGMLTDAFNQMLSHIESRDAALRNANKSLSEQEALLYKIIESAPYGMVMVDKEGSITLANAHLNQVFGYTSNELLGQKIENLIPKRYQAGHPKFRSGYHAKPELRIMGAGRDLMAQHKDGSEFPVEIGLNPIKTDHGIMVIAAVTDITIRKKLELDLKQANANLEEFTAVASHDLKSPLRGISDLIGFITEDLGSENISSEVQHNLDRISLRIKRMEQLVNDLLSYSRAGRAATDLTTIDPQEFIDNLVDMQAPPIDFEMVVINTAAPFQAVKTPLETVLRNLISNAIKHHDLSHGRIEIKAEEDDSHCIFTVTDDGPGIPEIAHDRVFKLFQTIAAKKEDSSGIGLAVAKRMVECHGGRIILESKDGVRGTTFKFWWPRFARKDLDDIRH